MRPLSNALLAATVVSLVVAPRRLVSPAGHARAAPSLAATTAVLDSPASRSWPGAENIRLRRQLSVRGTVYGERLGPNHPQIELTDDGKVLLADPDKFRICAYGLDGRQRYCFGERGALDGQLRKLDQMLLDPDGRLVVADEEDNPDSAPWHEQYRVQRFTTQGEFLDARALPFRLMAIGPDGTYYGWHQHRLTRLAPDGGLKSWGPQGRNDPAKFPWDFDAAVDSKGHVFLADGAAMRVRHYDGDGRLVATWGEAENGESELSRNFGLRVGRDDTLVAIVRSDELLATPIVKRFTREGTLLTTFPVPDNEPVHSNIWRMMDAVQVPDGTLLLVTDPTAILHRYTVAGERVGVWLNDGSEDVNRLPHEVSLAGRRDGSVRSYGYDGSWADVSADGVIVASGRIAAPPDVALEFAELTEVVERPDGGYCADSAAYDRAWCADREGSIGLDITFTLGIDFPSMRTIAAGPDRQLWVVEPSLGKLLRFDERGQPLGATDLPVTLERGLENRCIVSLPDMRMMLRPGPSGTMLGVEQCGMLEDAPDSTAFHLISPTGAPWWRRYIRDVFGLGPTDFHPQVQDIQWRPSGELVATAFAPLPEAADGPFEQVWLLRPVTGEALALDPGFDDRGLRIEPYHIAAAGPRRIWLTRWDWSFDGALEAFDLDPAPPPPPSRELALPSLWR